MAAWSLPEAERLRAASTVACIGTVASATRQHPQDPYEMRRSEASSSSTGAGSCVHDEHVWTGVGCRSKGSADSGVLHWRRTTQHGGG